MSTVACQSLAEKMPAVAAGTEGWTVVESAHLESCTECAAEWRLVQSASGLGRRVAAGIEPDIIARQVLARLREDRARRIGRRRWWAAGVIAAAAALAMLVFWRGNGEAPQEAPIGEVLPELERLETAELAGVLETFAGPLGEVPTLDGPALDDLNADELERVLDSWEG